MHRLGHASLKLAELSGAPMRALQLLQVFLAADLLIITAWGVAVVYVHTLDPLVGVLAICAFQALWFAAPLLVLTSAMLLIAGESRRALTGFGVVLLAIGLIVLQGTFVESMD